MHVFFVSILVAGSCQLLVDRSFTFFSYLFLTSDMNRDKDISRATKLIRQRWL